MCVRARARVCVCTLGAVSVHTAGLVTVLLDAALPANASFHAPCMPPSTPSFAHSASTTVASEYFGKCIFSKISLLDDDEVAARNYDANLTDRERLFQ